MIDGLLTITELSRSDFWILLGLTVPCRQLRRRRSPAIPDFSPLGRSPVTRVFPLLYPTNAFETRLGFSLHRAIKL